MSSLKDQLIRLGSANPALRPHIRPILSSLDVRVAGANGVRKALLSLRRACGKLHPKLIKIGDSLDAAEDRGSSGRARLNYLVVLNRDIAKLDSALSQSLGRTDVLDSKHEASVKALAKLIKELSEEWTGLQRAVKGDGTVDPVYESHRSPILREISAMRKASIDMLWEF